jgi:8-oxo-dGTP diphosphatase
LSPTRVIAAVIVRDGRFLICRRPLDKRHGGLWEFPGGKIDPGESDEDAIHRELREELGVEVVRIGAEEFAIEDPGSPFVIAFVPTEISGEPECREHLELAWGTPAELARVTLAPSDRAYVKQLLARSYGGERGN